MKTTMVWLIWLSNTILFVMLTRNPFNLLLIIVALLILGKRLAINQRGWIKGNLRFLISMLVISSAVNGLFTHIGQSVLFSFPEHWILIGGNITFESILYGAINGMIIGSLYLVFNVLNLALSIKQLTHLIPRAFHPIAMTTTVALTFFPSIQQRAREIKEAQMIRGNPMKKIPDWLPILLPLVVTSLEDAILLAESMTTRGFQVKTAGKNSNMVLIGLLLGGFSIFSGWIISLYNYPPYVSIILYLFGAACIVAALYRTGSRGKFTRYRQEIWHAKDILMTILFSITILSQITLVMNGRLVLSYSPYPRLTMPAVTVLGFVFSLFPILPVLVTSND